MKWGVVTNKMTRFTSLIAPAVPCLGCRRHCQWGQHTLQPHPAPLFAAAEQLGLEPHECIYVGMTSDIQAGQSCRNGHRLPMYGYLGTDDAGRLGELMP